MSADNVVYLKKMKNGWNVWCDYMSNDNPWPRNDREFSKIFCRKADALEYASNIAKIIGYVEYGVCEL